MNHISPRLPTDRQTSLKGFVVSSASGRSCPFADKTELSAFVGLSALIVTHCKTWSRCSAFRFVGIVGLAIHRLFANPWLTEGGPRENSASDGARTLALPRTKTTKSSQSGKVTTYE